MTNQMGNNSGLFDTTGLPNRGKEAIQSAADSLAKRLKDYGFQVGVEHGGSSAGPSSYLSVYDPETGRFFRNQVRISGHSKGSHESQFVWNVGSPEHYDAVVKAAHDMRNMGPSDMFKQKGVNKTMSKNTGKGVVEEEHMSPEEMKKREDIVHGMKKSVGDFLKQYGPRAKKVMYATATKQAMNDEYDGGESDAYKYRKMMEEGKLVVFSDVHGFGVVLDEETVMFDHGPEKMFADDINDMVVEDIDDVDIYN